MTLVVREAPPPPRGVLPGDVLHDLAERVLVISLGVTAALVSCEAAIPISPGSSVRNSASTLPLLGVLAAGGYLVIGGRVRSRASGLVGAWAMYVSVAAITTGWSILPRHTVFDVIPLLSVLAFLIVVSVVDVDVDLLRSLEAGAVMGATAGALWGIVGFTTGTLPVGQDGVARFSAVDAPNLTAAAMLLPCLVALATAMGVRQAAPGRPAAIQRRHRQVSGAAALIILVGILITGSRGGLLAVTAGVVMLGLTSGHRKVLTRGALTLVAVLGLGFLVAPPELRGHLTASHSTGRTGLWSLALEACEEHCLLGSGHGTFPQVYGETFRTSPNASGYHTAEFKAHNIWLETAVETGVGGILALLGAVAVTFSVASSTAGRLRSVSLSTITALLTANLFLSHLPFRYFWLVLALIALAGGAPTSSKDQPSLHDRTRH